MNMQEIHNLRKSAPAVYWNAVDMARDGKSATYIAGQIRWQIEAHNEKAAIEGRPLVSVSEATA